MRKMRRFKQDMPKDWIEALLIRNTSGVLAVNGDDGYPYGVPVNYAYCDGKIYFHSSKQGYKNDCLAASSKACFTVIDADEIIAEGYTSHFKSAIVTGNIRLTEGDERRAGLMAIVEKYSGIMPREEKDLKVEKCNAAAVYAIEIESMSGKQAFNLVKKGE